MLLARRNLRLGRGDRRGAYRLSLLLGTVGLLVGFLRAHHVADLAAVFPLLVGENPIVTVVCQGLWAAGFVFVLARVGLFAAMVSLFVNSLSTLGLITFNLSVPSSQTSYLIVGVIVVLGIYGLQTAIAGRPVLGAVFLKDEIAKDTQ